MKPSLWSLTAVSCFAAALDAAVTAALGGTVEGLPFSGVAAVSMTFSIAGALQSCRGFRLSLRALALSRDPYAVTAESGVSEDGMTILKSKRGTAGYLRRCEEPDCAENAYGPIAPFLLAAALVLAVIASAISGEWPYFFRIFAAITASGAPFAAFLAFPLPYTIITRRIFMSGSAIAGWAGLRDIGSSRHLIITDCDIFPAGTLSIESVRILEGTWPEKVISCVGSVICASGSGLAPVFTELMRRNNCSIQRVEEFCCHEGGGLTAQINGEEILCGSSGFMHLMGIRLPQKLASKSSVFVSINGVLSGIFTVKYVPVTSVQEALASLLHTRREPIFDHPRFKSRPDDPPEIPYADRRVRFPDLREALRDLRGGALVGEPDFRHYFPGRARAARRDFRSRAKALHNGEALGYPRPALHLHRHRPDVFTLHVRVVRFGDGRQHADLYVSLARSGHCPVPRTQPVTPFPANLCIAFVFTIVYN
jgi:hypothetical protein